MLIQVTPDKGPYMTFVQLSGMDAQLGGQNNVKSARYYQVIAVNVPYA